MTSSTISAKIRNSLQLLTELHGITEADICRESNISQATLWRLLNSDSDPRASTLNAIAHYFNITVDQLLGNQPITKTAIFSHQSTPLYLPIFTLENPQELAKMLGKTTPSNWNRWIDIEPTIKNSCFAVEVTGEAMWPFFVEGSFAIVDPLIKPNNKNYVLCQVHKTKEVIIRQYIEEHGEKFLKPQHYAYKTTALEKNDIILGVIIQTKNKFIDQ